MQRKWKRRWQRLEKIAVPPLAAGMLMLSAYSPVYANPAGGAVTSGSAAILTNGATTTINQTTNKAIINWQSFNIGKGETVNFVQPNAGSVALNRVIGNDASSIYGTLNANGKVYLVNPNGILFAPGSSVNVGGLVASTLNINDSDFTNGKYVFARDGSAGAVINQGTIAAAHEAVLIGTKTANEGIIAAKVTGLAAGNKVSLDFSGDSLLNVAVDTGAAGGSVTNSGTISASGGLVVMSAGTKDKLLNTVVNNSGIIRAQSIYNAGGVIRLEGGNAINSGTLDAAGLAGGTVRVLGDTVTLASGSSIDVSGDAGGGTALIGGAYQGGGSEYAATNTTVQNGAAIHADALTSGNGGNVVVWANDTTNFAGTITAKGGKVSGNGGCVEVSGKQILVYLGHSDTTAINGKTGNLLLDPGDYTISMGTTGGNVKNAAELVAELGSNNITLATDGTGPGNITVNSDLTWTSANTLTLSAHNNIYLNAAITATSGGLTLAANTADSGNGSTTGIITPTPGSSISVGTFTLQNGTWREINNNLSIFTATDFRITGGTFLRTKGGDGANTTTPYQIADVYGLQGIGSADMLDKHYILVNDIVASGTSTWNSYLDGSTTKYYGFTPIGTSSTKFTGNFDGAGHTITGLTINRPTTDYVALFSYYAGTGTLAIYNVGLSAASIVGQGVVGALAGQNTGSITNCYSTGDVTGSYNVGGLVGWNNTSTGAITGCYSMTTVKGSGNNVGGLVGYNYSGTIKKSYSNSVVTATASTYDASCGGLVGRSIGTIENCYSAGTVTGTLTGTQTFIGGLVGHNDFYSSTITNCYSTATVTGTTTSGSIYTGGLVGLNSGTIKNCYSTGAVKAKSSGTDNYAFAGGLVGYADGKEITNCYSTGAVISQSETSSSYARAGGLVGYLGHGTITNCYWNGETSWQANGIGNGLSGPIKLTTAQMQQAASYNWGTDITSTGSSTSVWRIYDRYTYPLLRSFLTPLTVTVGTTTTTYNGSWQTVTPTYSTSINTSLLKGSLSYTDQATNITGNAKNAGTYNVSANSLYSVAGGYDIEYANGTLTINPKVLTLTGSLSGSRTYGEGNSSIVYTVPTVSTGVGSETITFSGKLTDAGITSTSNATTYTNALGVDVTYGNGALAGNYSFTLPSGSLTITPRPITVTANASKVYGDTNPTSGAVTLTAGSLVGSDALGSANVSSTATTTSSVGDYSLTPSGVSFTSGSASNYNISYANGTLTITPRTLTVTANNASKHTGQANPTFTASYNGLANGDSPASLTGNLTFGTAATTTSGSGTYAIILTGTLTSPNYTIGYVNGALTVSGRVADPAYDSAVIHAEQIGFHRPGSDSQPRPLSAYLSPLSGYIAGAAGTYLPLTIRGINTSGYVTLTGLSNSGPTNETSQGGLTLYNQ